MKKVIHILSPRWIARALYHRTAYAIAYGYFRAIERALNQAASFEHIIEAVRWTHFIHWSPMIDVSDTIPTRDYNRVPPYCEPRERNTILRAIVDGEELEILNMNKLPNHQAAAAEDHAAVPCDRERHIVFL